MSYLYHHKYVHRWKGVYWLDKRGAELVSETIAEGLPFKEFRWCDEAFESNVPTIFYATSFGIAAKTRRRHIR